MDGRAFVLYAEGGDGDADGFGDDEGAEAVGIGQEDGEFFAAVTGGEVAGPGDGDGYGAGDFFQAFVAGLVAVGFVVGFEEVEVDEDDGQGRRLAQGAAPFFAEARLEAAAAVDGGEAVEGAEAGELLVFGGKFTGEGVEGVLVFEDAAADGEPAAQQGGVDGLGDLVVAAGFEAAGDLVLAAFGREEDDVDLAEGFFFFEPGAKFEAAGAGHGRVEEDERGTGLAAERPPGFPAAGGDFDLVAPFFYHRFEHYAGGCFAVDDHHFHPSFRLCVNLPFLGDHA